jgi:hypothetical protein
MLTATYTSHSVIERMFQLVQVIGDQLTHFGAFAKSDAGVPLPAAPQEAAGGCC